MLNDEIAKKLFHRVEFLRGECISDKLIELKQNELMSEEQIEEIRIGKLKRLLEHAGSYSPFYDQRLKDIRLAQVKTFDHLKAIEPLCKEELRENIKLIESEKPTSKMRLAKTSGSTGIPLVFPKDSITRAYHYAAMYRGHSWYGLKIGDREARLWGVPVYVKPRVQVRLVDYFLNRFREKEYKLTEEVLDDFYAKISKFRPKYIMGYGKMLYEFGLYLKGRKTNLEHLQLKMAKYTSENMNEEEKAIVEETYCCPVVSEYGAAETGIISFQCPKGSHHIMTDCVHAEYLDVEDENLGLKEVLITDLNNLSFPIIRYRLGDLVMPTGEKCSCGLPFPIFETIQGRMSDTFSIGKKKKYHSIIFYYIMKALAAKDKELLQFRVIQKSQNVFCYQLARKHKERHVEEDIIHLTKQELGPDVEIVFEYFENLPREASGKVRDFVSLDQG